MKKIERAIDVFMVGALKVSRAEKEGKININGERGRGRGRERERDRERGKERGKTENREIKKDLTGLCS